MTSSSSSSPPAATLSSPAISSSFTNLLPASAPSSSLPFFRIQMALGPASALANSPNGSSPKLCQFASASNCTSSYGIHRPRASDPEPHAPRQTFNGPRRQARRHRPAQRRYGLVRNHCNSQRRTPPPRSEEHTSELQ